MRKSEAKPSFAQSMVSHINKVVMYPRRLELSKSYDKVFDLFELTLHPSDHISHHKGFTYKGKLYPNPYSPTRGSKWATPTGKVLEALEFHLYQCEVMDKDWDTMSKCIGSVMSLCTTSQDIRNLLPDTLINKMASNTIPETRTMEIEDFPIESVFLKKAYIEVVLPKIDYYLALQLLM